MQKTAIQEKLFSLLQKDFQINVAELDFEKSVFDQMSADSMRMISIAATVEKEFGIELPLSFLENPTINNFISLIDEGMAEQENQNTKKAN